MARKPAPITRLIYGLDDRPPPARLLMYSIQWVVMYLPMLTLFTVLAGDVLDLTPGAQASFLQWMLLLSGGIIVLQTLWGHQLPLVDGPAMALFITLATLASGGRGAIGGGMLVGGFLIFLIGVLKLMKRIEPLFTNRVVGVILLLIGLTVLPFLLPMLTGVNEAHPHGRPFILFLSLFLTLVMAMMFHYLPGIWRSLSLFWGVLLGTLIFLLLGLVDTQELRAAAWLTAPSGFPGYRPEFDPGAIMSFVLAYLAVMVNTAGSLYSVEPLVRADRMERRFNRGLTLTGLSGILAGLIGVVGTVPYSLSPGIITVTRVGSRLVLTGSGVLLILMAFFGKLTALLSLVPDAVVASALLASIGAATGVSIEIIRGDEGPLTSREYLVVGLPVLCGMAAALLPDRFLILLPDSLRPIAGNGLIVGVVLVLLLEHVLLAKRKR